jgi:FAD:protein FMN transferase
MRTTTSTKPRSGPQSGPKAMPVRRAAAHARHALGHRPAKRPSDGPLGSGTGRARTRRDFLAAAQTAPAQPYGHWLRVHRPAMACRFEITLDAGDARFVPAAQDALNRVDAIEAQLTVFRDTSDLVHINKHAAEQAVCCAESLFGLLARCQELSSLTDGAFDIATTALSRCWGFLRRCGRLPAESEIRAAREIVGMAHVLLDHQRTSVRFRKPGVELNLGAIGKGYALDCVATTLRAAGVQHGLLSAGRSSLLALGGRDRGWAIDVISPRRDRPLARVWLRDAALGTSGASEQFVVVDGRRYGHVLDPRTGWPCEGTLSATVVCPSAADADALSTAFLVGGPALAERYCDRHRGVLALITPDDDSARTFVIGRSAAAEVEDP